jgi:hypothetical protein
MEHNEAQRLLPDYNRGSLTREQVRAFHAHLKGCEACQASMRVRHAVAKAKQAGPDESLPPALQAHVVKNRELLVKILLVMLLGALIFKLKK